MPHIGRAWAIGFAVLMLPSAWAKDEIWRQDTAAAFAKGKRQGVVVTDTGEVRLGRVLSRAGALDADRVWGLAQGEDGAFYAATGDKGRLWRRAGEGDWVPIYQSSDSQIFSVAVGREGVFLGTGPSGRVVRVDADGGHSLEAALGEGVKYVWGLAFAPGGELYAATGPSGQLWKRSGGDDPRWSLVYDCAQSHLLSLAIDAAGTVFVGTDGAGLIYRITPEGKVSVVLDAPQGEVRVLRIGPDGALYAGTATPGPDGPAGSGNRATTQSYEHEMKPKIIRVTARNARSGGEQDTAGTAKLNAGAAGENVVYRIEGEGAAREVFRARALIFALAWQGERLLVGTGPDGQLFELTDLGRQATPLARLDHGQILALLVDRRDVGSTLVATGDPGGVFRLGAGFVASGTLTSEVLDAKLPSRFGSLDWTARIPDGAQASVWVRTGNVGEPDETWSEWATSERPGSVVRVPNGRFGQYEVRLERGHARESPEVTSVRLAYQTLNVPPEIGALTIPDVAAGDGTVPRGKLELKWEAQDPNEDVLEYRVYARKPEWSEWLCISGDVALTEKKLEWDTTGVPSGDYVLKVVASDWRSNAREHARQIEKQSAPFVVDHDAPRVVLEVREGSVRCRLADDQTRLVKVEYAIDGGAWRPAFASDGLFDTGSEEVLIEHEAPAAGSHVIVVRATDAAGNVGSGDLVYKIP